MSSSSAAPEWDAGLYENGHSFVWKFGESLLKLLDPQPGERILDLGCGTGQLTTQIAAAGAEVTGLDRSAEMLEQARRSYPAIHFEQGDATAFSFAGPPFDAVFSNAVLHWVKPPEAAVARIRAALKPGGRFVAEFGGRGNNRQMLAALRRQTAAFAVPDFEPPWYFPGIPEYTGILERQGFEVTFATLFDRPTPLEGEAGLRNWFEMFLPSLLGRFSAEKKEAFLAALENELRPALYRDGVWLADYRRLRIVARLETPS
ncbi:MAG TPA: methyltransferase domain-containing protein [Planctomycetaceae bacterium]|nr:methyltransferase domain-containing protein [Planctomycetaceae bacterium]